MTVKVKVSRELGIALDELLNGKELDDIAKSKLLNKRANKQFSETSLAWGVRKNPLNLVSIIELARILDNGYEYELTPEEKALNYYNSLKDSEMEPNKHLASSIRHFLILAEIEFKGVTDTKDAIDDLDYSDLF